MSAMTEIFGKPISTYTRVEAIADGFLVDLTEWANESGNFTLPVAVTSSVWADIENIPASKKGWQDVRGRAHDLFWMAYLAVRNNSHKTELYFKFIMHVGRSTYQTYKVVMACDDTGAPSITIMQTNED